MIPSWINVVKIVNQVLILFFKIVLLSFVRTKDYSSIHDTSMLKTTRINTQYKRDTLYYQTIIYTQHVYIISYYEIV